MTPERFEFVTSVAAQDIDRLLASGFLRGPKWIRNWYDLNLRWTEASPGYVVLPIHSVDKLVQLAKDDHEVFQLATFVAGTRLAAGAGLPGELRCFVADYLRGAISVPVRKRGRPQVNTWGRDFIIYEVFYDLSRSSGLHEVQNPNRTEGGGHEHSVSEIMEAAIKLSDLQNLTRRQIEKIWERKKASTAEYLEVDKLRAMTLLDDFHGIERI